jgi:hypothetical protein
MQTACTDDDNSTHDNVDSSRLPISSLPSRNNDDATIALFSKAKDATTVTVGSTSVHECDIDGAHMGGMPTGSTTAECDERKAIHPVSPLILPPPPPPHHVALESSMEDYHHVQDEIYRDSDALYIDEVTMINNNLQRIDNTPFIEHDKSLQLLPEKDESSEQDTNNNERPNFRMGDHIYCWEYHLSMIPLQQHHAIVVDVVQLPVQFADGGSDSDTQPKLPNDPLPTSTDTTITHTDETQEESPKKTFNRSDSCLVWHLIIGEWQSDTRRFALRSIPYYHNNNKRNDLSLPKPAKWHHVKYQVSAWYKHTHPSGTCTTASRSPPAVVRARVEFAVDYSLRLALAQQGDPDALPPSWTHSAETTTTSTSKKSSSLLLSSSTSLSMYMSESWAVWCSTGTWATLQMTSWLWALSAGQVKSTATLAGMAATTTVTVPATGLWGWMGYTTQVAWLATQPLWVPWALAGYGVVTVGIPYVWLKRHGAWAHARTEALNRAFGEYALENSEQFAEKMVEWSEYDNE